MKDLEQASPLLKLARDDLNAMTGMLNTNRHRLPRLLLIDQVRELLNEVDGQIQLANGHG
ncbi:MAG: hypothetical protein HQL55_19660, partial [Magnetococcales bacterium]|nr:hypothetical protein [Magnetococcales bacterium]